MRNVISFHRNTEDVYILTHNTLTLYTICSIHTIRIKTFMCVHEFDFGSFGWALLFSLHIKKRSWNLCISHVLKWQNDGAQLYLLSDVFDTHIAHTMPHICYIQWLLFIGHFIYCFRCRRLKRKFLAIWIGRPIPAACTSGDIRCCWSCFSWNAVFSSLYSFYDRHPSTL